MYIDIFFLQLLIYFLYIYFFQILMLINYSFNTNKKPIVINMSILM